jgi:formylglycine-generating enzyme required for sulfatase activity
LENPGTRIETPSKPEITGTSIETPPAIPLEITDSIIEEMPEQLNNAEEAETQSAQSDLEEFNYDSNLYSGLALTPEDYLTESGQLLAQLCKELIEKEKVSKGWWIKASRFFKKHDVSQILGGKALLEKMEAVNKLGRVSREISDGVVQLAIRILKEKKPLAENEIENLIKDELAEEQIIGKVVKNLPRKTLLTQPISLGQYSVIAFVALLCLFFLIFGRDFNRQQGEEKNNTQTDMLQPIKEKHTKQNELAKFTAIEKDLVLIPAEKFMMGSPASEMGRKSDETQHEVTLTKSFYMGKYEVTQEQYESVMGNNPSSKNKGAKLPVTDVSWEDCQEFIKKLNANTKGGYRLPTEAEWEHACRAGTKTAYFYGDNLTKSDANIDDSSTKVVGSYKPNAFGLYDMHGNVWEWCNDWYGSLQNGEEPDPKGPVTGTNRVLRGGSFYNYVSRARSSYRFSSSPSHRDNFDYGFRLARTADLKAEIAPTLPKSDPAEVMPATVNLLIVPFTETKAKEVQKSVAKSLKKEVEEKEDLGKGIKLDLVLIPAGKFKMGSPESEKGRDDNEPQHEVTLTKPIYMGKYEVTQEQWEAVMGSNPSSNKGPKLPVTVISWNDCQEFITKLNAKTNGCYRLPTEEEWEYACRAGTSTAYSFGDGITPKDANYKDSNINQTIKIGSYTQNAFGLYDMHGNVFEWCENWKAEYTERSATDPKGPATGERRVLRGGAFYSNNLSVCSSCRNSDTPNLRFNNVGFRLARTADTKLEGAPVGPKSDPTEVMPATVNLLVAPFTETKAKEIQKEVAKILHTEVEEKEDLGKGVKLDLILIPAGKFKMGSPESEKGRDDDEAQHEVTLTKPFYMGKYEVTQEQWEVVMGNNPSKRTIGANLPVTDVSWEDCQEFIKKLNAKTNGGYRLPTEAEWEYACRTGTSTAYSYGDRLTTSDANINGSSIKAVGSYKPNAFGLYDMHGNVWEWCSDKDGSLQDGEVTDPKGTATGTNRVLRGGSFYSGESSARSSFRLNLSPSARNDIIGFRLARNADLKAEIAPTEPKSDPAEVMSATSNILIVPFTETKAKEVQKSVAKSLKKEVEEKEDLGKGIKLDLVLIPAGKFKMGSPESEKGRDDDEAQHEVTLTKTFYMGKYEVTQEQWESVMGNNPSSNKGAKLPVTDISWEDCQEFIMKLNAKTNSGYRLPTEAEWEYACRAGTTTAYSFGDSLTKNDANYFEEGSVRSIKAVGKYKPNTFGLYDLNGNVWEWCEDWKADYPKSAVTDPKGPGTETLGMLRGGSFNDNESEARSSNRFYSTPTNRSNDFGFRLARTPVKAVVTAPTAPKSDPAEVIPAVGNLLLAPFSEAKAKELQKSLAKSLQKEVEDKEDLGKGIKLDLVLIPAGKFEMGSPASEKGRNDDEKQHEVTLTKPFYMGKYEVTQEQYEAVMGNNPSSRTKGAKFPVTDVSWEDCQEFIKKLNAKTNGSYRLPTETEWEYSCRAGTTTTYSFGVSVPENDANIGGDTTKAVGSYKPNAFNLYDMHGNVWEWCNDWKAEYPAGAVTDPTGPATGGSRVLRGGSFLSYEKTARSSDRSGALPTIGLNYYGFRLARTADLKTEVTPTVPKLDLATLNLLVAPFNETKAKEEQIKVAKSLQKEVEDKVDLGKGIKLEMVLIPAGKFKTGDTGEDNEITLTKPYYMGKYEVTQEQWESVMGNKPNSKTKGAKLPVTDVSWEDCQDFIKKLNTKTNGGYRLATEAEWEYACRAGTTTAYSFGDSLTESDANINGSSTKAVGNYKPNAFGLYDMHGNVLEWCDDWYAAYPKESVIDPKGPPTGKYRVLRGGSFFFFVSFARSSFRENFSPTNRYNYVGFRLAQTP